MRSEEICTGLSVRVSSSSGSAQKQNGKVGTVVHIYGNPSYVAVDVAFDDGSSDLFWHYQVDNHENGTQAPGQLATLSDTRSPDRQITLGPGLMAVRRPEIGSEQR
jgi:hypothetical protein